ncbi:DUF1254 domain-containing protein [Kutzneria chonburiensis]|uniref:DUF1254 domain-containing protein n=1 Tax=Kutzneria chonburiensis TaxID=1483604 RepID=A0ABV6MIP4_9PSEU|nr:DUF1254 domain-containing protein [Kutzneria chonburiensis]
MTRRTALALAAGAGLSACGISGNSVTANVDTDPKSIAADAYLYGFPLVLMDVTRGAALANQLIRNTSPATARSRGIVAPQNDTLFSLAWLDLHAEPMVFQMPAVDGRRFWLIQVLDAWMNTVHDPSSVRPAGQATPFTYALTGPGWSGRLPDGLIPLAMPTPTGLIANRIQLDGAADLDAVRALQAQVMLTPLSFWTAGTTAPDVKAPPPSAPPLDQVNAMDGRTFFRRMATLLAATPTPPADADALKRFASIGIAADADVDQLDADVLNAAVHDGQARIAGYTNPKARIDNGWTVATNIGAYGTDYVLRANTAKIVFGANLAKDSLYALMTGIRAGASRRYRIRFAAGQLPPVDAFWSISVYGPDQYFIANPANVYAVGHETPVVPGSDGTVEITLQSAHPGPEVPAGNWLPIPENGTFTLALRLYAPKAAALDGTWKPPALTVNGQN